MKIPGLGKIATAALQFGIRAAAKAIADGKNPLTKDALEQAVKDEARHQVARRVGM